MDISLVDLAPFHALEYLVTDEIKAKLATARQAMLDGTLRVPHTFEEIGMDNPVTKK